MPFPPDETHASDSEPQHPSTGSTSEATPSPVPAANEEQPASVYSPPADETPQPLHPYDGTPAPVASTSLPEYRPGEPGATSAEADAEDAEQRHHHSRRLAIELVQTMILALLIFFAVRTMAQNFKVEGSSMEPGLHDGQYLLVNKAVYFKINMRTLARVLPFIHVGDNPERYLFHGPHRGDVIVFRYPNDPSRDFIKRVIGVPGDTVEIRDGTLLINDKAVPEDFLESSTLGTQYQKTTVPAAKYFVLGDNRNNSSDSRAWGFVPQENVIGQAMLSYWPFSNFGGVGNRHFNLGSIGFPVHIPLHVPF
jgi:signal peptidase I